MSPLEPSADQRRTVKTMAGFGVPQDDIATFLGIDAKTLRKHFREELDRGMTEANAKVAQSLFQMATQGKNVAAAIFWMKARAGWREKQELTVKPGLADGMSVEELDRVIIHIVDEMEANEKRKQEQEQEQAQRAIGAETGEIESADG